MNNIFLAMPLFAGMTDLEVNKIIQKCKVQNYHKGECIARENEPCNAFGIVAEGEVVVLKETASGESQILDKFSVGKTFGEMLAYSSRRKWPATIWAVEDTIVYFMDLKQMSHAHAEFSDSYEKLIHNFIRELSDKALGLNKKLEYLSIKKLRGKLSKYLLEQANSQNMNEGDYFQIPLNRNELADFLAVSRPSMSRELSKMKEDGLLDFYKNQFRILDEKKLKMNIQ